MVSLWIVSLLLKLDGNFGVVPQELTPFYVALSRLAHAACGASTGRQGPRHKDQHFCSPTGGKLVEMLWILNRPGPLVLDL
eukprot:1158076-Pelagomonas_calceolata.AAC.1